ncbi:hypothetical protein COS12_02120 [Candidatus Roizmanbacteria bacterium CG01_land_8_20_14_3_00_33_9]|uniref:Glycosyltransferase RgtA/B/C/D-like domain-containing protein n=1 Tax=Candidatus Roizmanbacteria bacterium CG01_land_8_20_14_3_00_33_9 TaxID=1974843 RepID=A0A2M7E468_9BACT|nr:MAG: hypothetical protein COS12_02120 [Candidatus Roizmanbacteria bacterium CG01_land_8_20_14_3_00_33_9]
MRRIYPYFTLTLVVFLSTLVLWSPFLLKANSWFGLKISQPSFDYVYRHYDGPLYIIPAKTLYNPKSLEIGIPPKYFAAHLPGYPMLIRVVREIRVFGGYLKSMLIANLLATVGLTLFFYFFLKKFKLTKKPLLLTAVFLFLPRFLVVRSVGAPESLFILLILGSLYFFEKERYLLAGLFGGLAAITKTPGILLFGAYCLVFVERLIKEKKTNWQWLGIILIPLGLLGAFGIFWKQYGDFFAYFHSGDNLHLVFPFSVFNFQKPWVGTAWLEDVVFYFFLYGLTIFSLKNIKQRSLFYFSLVFYIAALFIQHRDISRYSLPLWPMALIAYEKFFTSKKFLIVGIIILLAVYLYAWNFMIYNVMPIADWKPYL